jgi:hypothetical protein
MVQPGVVCGVAWDVCGVGNFTQPTEGQTAKAAGGCWHQVSDDEVPKDPIQMVRGGVL